jgi:hypothetical protein
MGIGKILKAVIFNAVIGIAIYCIHKTILAGLNPLVGLGFSVLIGIILFPLLVQNIKIIRPTQGIKVKVLLIVLMVIAFIIPLLLIGYQMNNIQEGQKPRQYFLSK